jgi:hypothetical protein
MCPLGRFDPLQISSKVPLYIMMIGVDGRARTGIIAGTARSGPTIFHKSNKYIYMDIAVWRKKDAPSCTTVNEQG